MGVCLWREIYLNIIGRAMSLGRKIFVCVYGFSDYVWKDVAVRRFRAELFFFRGLVFRVFIVFR